MAITDAGRREQVEREANEILAKATAESDRLLVAAAIAEDRGAQIEHEANEFLARARTEAVPSSRSAANRSSARPRRSSPRPTPRPAAPWPPRTRNAAGCETS